MANIVEITSITDEAVMVYASLTEKQLLQHPEGSQGLFIAESPKVIRVALAAGYEPVSLLCERRHITGDAADIIASLPDLTVYTGERSLLAQLTGYTLTRGVLCAMRRKSLPTPLDVCREAQRVVIIDNVSDTTNIGAIFRSAAAMGIDAVLLTRGTCDPLNRRAIRVSMGSVFLVPWTWVESADSVKVFGLRTAAMALTSQSVSLDDAMLCSEPRLAIIMGSEGDGLSASTIQSADYVVRIPMHNGVDSLNVAAAAAVAFWQLRKR